MNNLLYKASDIWQKYILKLSVERYRNYFRKKMKIVKKFETIGLNLCESCNLISYRDQEIVEWNRSGILLVTSILITMIMMTIAIFDGFPAPMMGCAAKTCFTDIMLPPTKQGSFNQKTVDNQDGYDHQEEIVTASRWMSSKLYLLRDR